MSPLVSICKEGLVQPFLYEIVNIIQEHHIHTHPYRHIHTHTYTHIHIHPYTNTYTHINTHTHTHTHTHKQTHTHTLSTDQNTLWTDFRIRHQSFISHRILCWCLSTCIMNGKVGPYSNWSFGGLPPNYNENNTEMHHTRNKLVMYSKVCLMCEVLL